MKKFKLVALALLASAFGLTSCDLPEFVQVPVDWTKEHVIDPVKDLIPGGDKKEEESKDEGDDKEKEKEDEKVTPEVVSVKISGLPADINDETGPFVLSATVEVKGDASKEVTWSSSNTSVATVDANGKVTLGGSAGEVTIKATSKFDSSKSASVSFEVYVKGAILSVTVKGAPEAAVDVHGDPVELSVEVATKGQIAKGVSWSSSNESIATVSDEGVVTFYRSGSVTITATSISDSSKSGSVEISAYNNGLHPELLEDDCLFAEEFPAEAANAFAGADVFSFETAEGFYYFEQEESEESMALFGLLFEYTQENIGAVLGIEAAGYQYYSSSDYDLEFFIDPTISFEVALSVIDIGGEDSSCLMIAAYVLHVEDLWEASELTTDTAWDDETAEYIASAGIELPFIALAEGYDAYQYSSGMIEISDYSPDFHRLEGYGELLIEAGFEIYEEEGEIYYHKIVDEYNEVFVYLGFNEYGNAIQIYPLLRELEEFPSERLSEFVASFSKYEVPAPVVEGASYTYEASAIEFDDGERDAAIFGLYNVSESDAYLYALGLMEEGFVLDEESYSEYYLGSTSMMLQKGKIIVLVEIEYTSRAASDSEIEALYAQFKELSAKYEAGTLTDEESVQFNELYSGYLSYVFGGEWTVYEYDEVSAVYVGVTSDPKGIEEPGVHIYEDSAELPVGGELQLEPIFWEIEEQPVVYSSSDESVATVDENGLVTGVANGEAVITVAIDGTEYSDSILVAVHTPINSISFADEVAMYLEAGIELTIPDFEGDDLGVSYDADSGKYTITNATQEDAVNFYNALAEAGWSVTELSGNFIDFTATFGPYASIKVDDWINTSKECLYITFALTQEAEFPMDALNEALAELGTSATLPAFSGVATDYFFQNGYLFFEVGAGNEAAGISTYQADLLAAGYTEIGADSYGDMHYLSPNGELDACIWQSSTSGYIALQFGLYVAPAAEFPLEEVNAFLSENGFGLEISQEVADALTALLEEGQGFTLEYGTAQGYPFLNIAFNGEHAAEAEEILASALAEAGFEYDEEDGAYYNDDYLSASFSEDGGFTSIFFW